MAQHRDAVEQLETIYVFVMTACGTVRRIELRQAAAKAMRTRKARDTETRTVLEGVDLHRRHRR